VHTSTLIHSRFSYLYPSFLLHESCPHDDHIYVHVYVDVLHERQVTEYADLDCILPFACEYAKSNSHPCAYDVRYVQLCSYDVYPHTAYHLLVWELGSSSHHRSIQRNNTKMVGGGDRSSERSNGEEREER
jgi:hypothetical protein